MKIVLPIRIAMLLCVLYSTTKAADSPYIKITAVDAIGQRDSVVFTLDDNATMGIDAAFGEVNLYGKPYSSLDIRIIQRDQKTGFFINVFDQPSYYWFNTNYGKILSTANIDLKKEYRSDKYKLTDGSLTYFADYTNFIVLVSAEHYPVTLFTEDNEFHSTADYRNVKYGMFAPGEYYRFIDTTVGFVMYQNQQIMTIASKASNNLIGFFTYFTGAVDDDGNSADNFTVYPTIADDRITISQDIMGKSNFKIYSIAGSLIQSLTIGTSPYDVDVSAYPRGIYIVQGKGRVEKFVKY